MKDLQQLVKGGSALMAVLLCSCQPVSDGVARNIGAFALAMRPIESR